MIEQCVSPARRMRNRLGLHRGIDDYPPQVLADSASLVCHRQTCLDQRGKLVLSEPLAPVLIAFPQCR